MTRRFWLLIMLFASISMLAQTGNIRGIVIDYATNRPVADVKVSVNTKKGAAVTNANGAYELKKVPAGVRVVVFTAPDYKPFSKEVNVVQGNSVLLNASLEKKVNVIEQSKEDNVLLFDESVIDDEGSTSGQSASYLAGASDDVYLNAASYSFSPMRFNVRGYDQSAQETYINGVNFNDLERGRFNYSSLGGLNDAMRNKDVTESLVLPGYGFGSLGGMTNIDTRASAYAAGTKVSAAYTNRAYTLRGQATYATGLMDNGWAFTASTVYRWANEGIIDGTFYNSWGYFLSAEKKIDNHSFSLTTYGAPTKRAQQGAVVQEIYDYRGIYYNPYWGYQDGKKRNSRIVHSYDPTAIFNWDWKIDEKSDLKAGIAFHYSNYSNSALNFYNAPDPRPDYYRNLPSFQKTSQLNDDEHINWDLFDELKKSWTMNNTNVTQLDWNFMYGTNYLNNLANPGSSSRYMLERRHNNLMEIPLNVTYDNQLNESLKLIAGVEAKYSKGMHYKTVDDLLGGEQWIDIDQFADRDFTDNLVIIQNDVRNPNRVVKDGDKFGYNYNIYITRASAFAQNDWKWSKFDLSYAVRLSYTQFQREGLMENGRATVIGAKSYGRGKSNYFVDPSIKVNLVWKIDGRNRLSLDGLAETRAPFAGYAYVAPRVKDTQIKGLTNEKIFSYDLNYQFNTSIVKGRVSVFQTFTRDGIESTGYYNDEFRTFVNHTLSDVNKRYMGVEAGVSVKLNSSFSVSLAGTYGDYRYTNNAKGVMSAENGVNLFTGELPVADENGNIESTDLRETVYTKNLKVSNGPQLAAAITIDYFHPKMWFADVTLSYFDKNYLDFSPSRFTHMNMYGGKYKNELGKYQQYDGYTPEQKKLLGTQEKLKGGFLLDASLGKLIYLKGRSQQLNINLSFSNILNNRDMVTGGYQQARLSRNNKSATKAIETVDKFPNRYYYAWGFNMFLNIGYKF